VSTGAQLAEQSVSAVFKVEMKQLSPGLRRSEPVAGFLQGSLIWITDYEELIDGRWHTFTSIRPRKIGHSPCEDDMLVG
jgi:hypothetical protein